MRAIRTNNNSSQYTERSLNSSTAFSTTTIKQKYPKCEIKKQHNKDLLNLVCLTSTCKNKGVICSVCKSESHLKHNVIPIKTFLSQVKDSYKVKK